MLPRHPQTVAHKHPIEGAAALVRERGGQLAPRVALDLDGADGSGGRQLRTGVARGVGGEVGDDDWRGVVGQNDAGGAEEGGEQRGQGGPCAELQYGAALDVECGQRGPEGALDAALLRVQAEGAGFDELGQQERGVPEVMAKELAVVIAYRVCQADVQGLGQMG